MRLKNVLFVIASLLTTACRTSSAEQPPSQSLAVWGDDMTYNSLDEDEKDGKQAIKIAKKYAEFQNYYPRYRIGNLAIIDASTPPPPSVMDAKGKHATIGVILGDEPKLINFPNQELFEHFMNIVRNDPSPIKNDSYKDPKKQKEFAIDIRNRMTLLLSTGNSQYLDKHDFKESILKKFEAAGIKPEPPVWKEDNGTLTIQYYVMKSRGMMAATPSKCIILVDESQKYTHQCTNFDKLMHKE